MSKNNKSGSKAPAKTNAKPAEKTTAKKSSSSLIALIIVLIAAVALIAVMFSRSNNLNAQVDNLTSELAASQSTLQQTITDPCLYWRLLDTPGQVCVIIPGA